MKKFLFLILFVVLILPTLWQALLPGYFAMHDDLQVMRLFQMEKCLQDGQVPCRWAPDMAYGYGQPMFNFYSAFPYYLGGFTHLVTSLSLIDTVKALFIIAILFSGLGMFLLSKKFFGFWGGLVSAIFYVYAPYHALDLYVRGAVSESFSLMLLPILWLTIYEVIKNPKTKWILSLSATLAALLSTHNVSTMLYVIPSALWAIFWLFVERKNFIKSIISLAIGGALGVSIASFFIIPVFVEKNFIQSEFLTVNYLNYQNHFVSLRQLFLERKWGYGPSIFGDTDDISFQLGIVHWIASGIVGLLVFRKLVKKEFEIKVFMVSLLLFLAGFASFMTHAKSLFIWQSLESTLAFVQFPWRFLGLSIFFMSFAAGYIIPKTRIIKQYFAMTLIFLSIALNYSYFTPLYYFPQDTDQSKLSGESFIIQSKAAILDYLPKTAKQDPHSQAGKPSVAAGDGEISNFIVRSNFFFFDAQMYHDGTVDIPVTYYPGWEVVDVDKLIPSRPDGILGTIYIDLSEGKHLIKGRFRETPLRQTANIITLVGFGIFLVIFIKGDTIDKRWLS